MEAAVGGFLIAKPINETVMTLIPLGLEALAQKFLEQKGQSLP